MRQIAALLIYTADGQLLFYLRDNKAEIPYPHHWDLFGGHVEAGESVEEALEREIWEELRWKVPAYHFFRQYETSHEPGGPSRKFVFFAELDQAPASMQLYEGERLQFFEPADALNLRFSHIIRDIVADFLTWESCPEALRRK